MARDNGPFPGGPAERSERIQILIDFWNALGVSGDSGETTMGDLEAIQAKVTDCLNREPKDIARAEGLTAYALMLMTGQVSF